MRKIIITEDQYKRLIEQKWYNPDTSEYRQWIEDYGLNNKRPLSSTKSLNTLISGLGDGEIIEIYSFYVEPMGNPVLQFKTHMKSYAGYSPTEYSGYDLGNNEYVFFYVTD